MIELTPLDVRKKKGDFARGLRGYDPASVDAFLDIAAERMEELLREAVTLRERVARLTDSLSSYQEREKAMNEALIAAQQLREELRDQAERDAERVRAEARQEAEDATDAIRRTVNMRARTLRELRTFLERQLEEIQHEERRLSGSSRLEMEGAAALDHLAE